MERGARAVCVRLAAFTAAVMVGSALGSRWTWTTPAGADADPLTACAVGLVSLGGAALVAAFAPLGARATALVAVTFALSMVAMWWLFARSDSSTSSLVFVGGWLAGVPAAAVLGAVASTPRRRAAAGRG